MGLAALAQALTGCLGHTRVVPKTRLADVVMSTSVETMAKQLNDRFDEVKTLSASVSIVATTGGGLQGFEKDSVSFSGYIFIRKPEQLRVLLRVPVLGSTALDMVSDGQNFKMVIPPRNRAIVGTNVVTKHSKNGLENLRPPVFFDSMLVRGLGPSQVLSLTSDTRVVDLGKKGKDLVEEPSYDVIILGQPEGQLVHTLRVVHINSTDLLPYAQDIYDESGQVVTKAFYSNYQNFGDIPFPTTILIQRPQDHYSLKVTIIKLTLNQKMEDDQFELKIPEGIPIQKME
jgi:outer membrane lipoprotein-sorting protein